MPDTISPIEVIWTGIALSGLAYSWRILHRYSRAARRVRASPYKGVRRRLAQDLADWFGASERSRFTIHCISSFAGIVSFFFRNTTASPRTFDYTVYGIYLISSIVAINLLTVLNSRRALRSWERWGQLVRELRKEEKNVSHSSAPGTSR